MARNNNKGDAQGFLTPPDNCTERERDLFAEFNKNYATRIAERSRRHRLLDMLESAIPLLEQIDLLAEDAVYLEKERFEKAIERFGEDDCREEHEKWDSLVISMKNNVSMPVRELWENLEWLYVPPAAKCLICGNETYWQATLDDFIGVLTATKVLLQHIEKGTE